MLPSCPGDKSANTVVNHMGSGASLPGLTGQVNPTGILAVPQLGVGLIIVGAFTGE